MRAVLLSFCFLLLAIVSGWAQQEDIKFKHIATEQGLSQSTVKCISKDKRGYMWFGTRDGLNKYDGYQLTIYKHQPDRKESIGDNFIASIYEDSQGRLWIGTMKGLDQYDPEKDAFRHFPLEINNITSITEDRQHHIWVSAFSGLFRLNPTQGSFQAYYHDANDPHSLLDDRVMKVTIDNTGLLWLSTMAGLDQFNAATGKFKHYTPHIATKKDFLPNRVQPVFQDRKGNIWIGFVGKGLALFNPKSDSFQFFQHNPNNSNSLCHNEVLSLMEDKEGKLWIGTQNGGISIFDHQRNEFKTLRQDMNNPTSLSNNSIHALYKDDQGNMWVGTWAGGVNLYSPWADKFISYQKILHFNNPNIYSITGDNKGNIWIGKEDAGLIHFDRKSNTFRFIANEHQQEFLTEVIFHIVNANEDTLALAYHRGGFAFFNKRTGKFTHFLPEANNPYSLIGDTKTIVLKDSTNNYWIGSWGEGLHYFDKQTRRFTNYGTNLQDSTTLSDQVVFALCEDKDKNLWVGTQKGLNRLDRKTNQFTRYFSLPENKHSLSHNTVHSLLLDRQGQLWVGTVEGLNLFDKKSQTFTAYTEKDGLSNNVINSILEDDKGTLWLGTNNGISHFNPLTKTFRNYYVQDGLQGNEFNRNGCFKASDGTMFFAGTKGFTMFHPDSIVSNPHIPPVVLTNFLLFNKSVTVGEKDSLLTKHISCTKQLTLPYSSSVFSFEFAALNFTNSDKNAYAYKMEGFDKDWNYVDNQRLATYTNLDPGEYTFMVKGSNNDQVWNKKGTSIKVVITPPFWQTWWFRSLVALAVIGSSVTFYRVRMNVLRAQKEELEKQVLARTAEVVQQKEKLQFQAEFLQTVNGELQEKQEEIEVQRDHLQKVNEHVTSSIQYAKTIQQAILPSAKKIAQAFPEHFILYRPKDIVSGDFYWFSHLTKEDTNSEGDYTFMAVIDCTGHGVPGAFMSIIGNTLLNEIINQKHLFDPASILEHLDKGVRTAVEKTKNVNTAGMDVCLCRIERGEGNQVRLLYAGAKRPLFYLEKQSDQPECLEGDRRSIGSISMAENAFITQELLLKKETILYLSSDGYVDQNNLQRVKLGTPRLKQAIQEVAFLPLSEQLKHFETMLDQHQLGTQQRDDITLVAVQI